jgi:hypothetical protein
MESAYTEDYESVVASIANEYHRKYPMVEQQDIRQTLWMWFVTHPVKYKEWSVLEQKDKDKLIAKSLRHAAIKYCEQEKARTVGYELLDLYYYDVSVVEAFLPSIISESYEIPTKIKDIGSQVKSNEINDGNNWLVLRSDIASAFYKLTDAKQNILRIRYSTESSEWSEVAKDLDTTAEGARKKVQRALASLVRNLGGFRPKSESDEPQERTNNGE